ncbi:Fatty-acid-binding protein 1 [Apostasia shenzhenica]|uniref:Chalcone--flavanone isomerase n=1 Tax=Apostasia shenzhenica TaxID=1088818 RepID=A0A2I0APJ0_9ASPA|nr:Fatty-acid-binding protein 1 [Apostasia shenzhenica]
MVSLRFPLAIPHRPSPRRPNLPNSTSFRLPPWFVAAAAATVAGATAGIGVAVAVASDPSKTVEHFSLRSLLGFCSLSLADSSTASAVEPKTGAVFPTVVNGDRRLLGIGLRRKNVFGLKNIDVYAYDVLVEDLRMTVRLQIVYGKLSIGSVRSAFEESVGNRLKKFSGSETKDLLKRFTSLFKDEYKLPRGSVIDLSREQGYILQTNIDGQEVGSIQSKLLCQAILDLYIGEDSFDKNAKEAIELGLVSLLQN